MSSVSVSNCIKFYQTAEDIGAIELRKYCEEIITNHWVWGIIENQKRKHLPEVRMVEPLRNIIIAIP